MATLIVASVIVVFVLVVCLHESHSWRVARERLAQQGPRAFAEPARREAA